MGVSDIVTLTCQYVFLPRADCSNWETDLLTSVHTLSNLHCERNKTKYKNEMCSEKKCVQ